MSSIFENKLKSSASLGELKEEEAYVIAHYLSWIWNYPASFSPEGYPFAEVEIAHHIEGFTTQAATLGRSSGGKLLVEVFFYVLFPDLEELPVEAVVEDVTWNVEEQAHYADRDIEDYEIVLKRLMF